MENFKFIVFSIIVLSGIGILGYWAVITIQPGDIHVSKQKQIELAIKNAELEQQVTALKNQLASLQPPTPATPAPSQPVNATPLTYQSLINDLQKLIDANVIMKVKSTGARVGTVQTFLNIYNSTSKKVDNDFGKSMKTSIINFQTAEGLPADGVAGATTFQKMIDWLTKQ